MFCKHKYGKVEEDGYQYCEKCGKANLLVCSHKWKEVESGKTTTTNRLTGHTMKIERYFILRCSRCGEMKEETF